MSFSFYQLKNVTCASHTELFTQFLCLSVADEMHPRQEAVPNWISCTSNVFILEKHLCQRLIPTSFWKSVYIDFKSMFSSSGMPIIPKL